MSSMENIATRSARLQAEISNRQLAAWLSKNEQKLLAHPELQAKEATPLKKDEPEQPFYQPPRKAEVAPPTLAEPPQAAATRREYLNEKFGRTGDVLKDIYIRGNKTKAASYFESQGMLPENYRGYMNGLDFSQPVSIETFNAGKKLWQFQVPGGVQGM